MSYLQAHAFLREVRRRSVSTCWWGVILAWCFLSSNMQAQELNLRFQTVVGAKEARFGTSLSEGGPRVTRLDFLLSELALRRKDGSWLESQDWFAYLGAGAGRMTAEGTGVPKGEYVGLRFRVGVTDEVDRGDPSRHPPGHALNPQVNGLHWGWLGGYVFLALEGFYPQEEGEGGFSFHLANGPQLMMVELPVTFSGGRPLTVDIDLDLERALNGIDFAHGETVTHSRKGDSLAAKLKDNLEHSFRVRGVHDDVYQKLGGIKPEKGVPSGAHRLNLAVTRRFPQVSLPVDNPLTREGVELGRRLFQEARLSSDGTLSCASCHQQERAFADLGRRSLGVGGRAGTRNAPALFNLAWQDHFFWDGRVKTLREQVLLPVQDKNEMNETLPRMVAKLESDATYRTSFTQAFGSPGVTAERVALALEQFLLTLVSQESRFDRAARKAIQLTESEKRGLQLFVTEFDPARGLRGADCFHCHGGTLFKSQQFANNGLELMERDVGRMAVTGNEMDRGKFKTPSLRNIAYTAPYMHDGRFATLEEVIEHYSGGVKRSATLDPNLAKHPERGLQLTSQEKADLVAFLKTLSDESFTGAAPATIVK